MCYTIYKRILCFRTISKRIQRGTEKMENERKCGAAKKVLRVIGIILSIILIPVLVVGIPVGGAVIGASSVVSKEAIEEKVEDIGLSDIVLDVLEERVLDGVHEIGRAHV